MFTLILASHSAEADRPDLVFIECGTIGEVLEQVAELEVLTADELAVLDDDLCDTAAGPMWPIAYMVGDFGVTCGCVVRL